MAFGNRSILQIVLLLFCCNSCTTNENYVLKRSQHTLKSIEACNLNEFKSNFGGNEYYRDSFKYNYYFQEACNYFKKYSFNEKKCKYFISQPDNFHEIKVKVPIFSGYDTTNGIRKLDLNLYFRPLYPTSTHSEMIGIDIYQDVDFEYRNILRKRGVYTDDTLDESLTDSVVEMFRNMPQNK